MSENEISIVVKLKVVRFVKMTKSGDFPLRVFSKNWEEFPVALLLLAQLSTQLSLLRFWRSRASHFRALFRGFVICLFFLSFCRQPLVNNMSNPRKSSKLPENLRGATAKASVPRVSREDQELINNLAISPRSSTPVSPKPPEKPDPRALLLGAIARAGVPRPPPDDEVLVPPGIRKEVCPYESLHVVRRSKLLAHLKRCRKEHPENNYIFCPFNEHHLVEIVKLPGHVTDCPENPVNKEKVLLEYVARTGGFTDVIEADSGHSSSASSYVTSVSYQQLD